MSTIYIKGNKLWNLKNKIWSKYKVCKQAAIKGKYLAFLLVPPKNNLLWDIYHTVSVLGQDKGYTVEYSPPSEGYNPS